MHGQVPSYIPYQAIARDGSGQIKANTPVQVEFKIFNTMLAGSSAYDELHTLTTNDFGYFNLRIGSGTVQSGAFSAITWQTGDVSYEVWVDMGAGFTMLGGRSGFLSVPYALYAANSSPNPTISINAPNTISNPSPGNFSITVSSSTYSAGAGISISGSTITNSAPDQMVSITGSNVSGSYPNYTITSTASSISAGNSNILISGTAPNFTITDTPSLSIVSGQLSISNGNTVTIPSTSVSAGTNVSVTGSAPNYTIDAVTPTLTASGNATISGIYPSQTVSVASQSLSISGNTLSLSSGGGNVTLPSTPSTTITQGTNISVSGSAPNYTVAAITPTLTASGNATIIGSYPSQTVSVASQSLSISGNTLSLSGGGGSVAIAGWNTNGNAGTSVPGNFIGTTDNNGFAIRTNNSEHMRITSTGSIGIGTTAPAAGFDINSGDIKLGAGSTAFSVVKYGTASVTILLSLGNNAGTFSVPGAQSGDAIVVTLNSHNASAGSISLNNAGVSGVNTVSYNVSTSLGLLATMNFSYILMRP
ncbi:MAG: beta strand repeat-containing protein [Bacteroidia bacterium]